MANTEPSLLNNTASPATTAGEQLIDEGLQKQAEGRFDTAISYFEQAGGRRPGHAEATRLLFRALRDQMLIQHLIRHKDALLNGLDSTAVTTTAMLNELSQIAMDDTLNSALTVHDRLDLAEDFLAVGDTDRCLAAMKGLDGSLAKGRLNYITGRAQLIRGAVTEAINSLLKAADYCPQSYLVQATLANALDKLHATDSGKSHAMLSLAVLRNTDDPLRFEEQKPCIFPVYPGAGLWACYLDGYYYEVHPSDEVWLVFDEFKKDRKIFVHRLPFWLRQSILANPFLHNIIQFLRPICHLPLFRWLLYKKRLLDQRERSRDLITLIKKMKQRMQ